MMPTYVTREEFDARMRVLEGEVEGEKTVTRYILEQTYHNSNDLASLKGDMALVKAALTSHSGRLNVLTQDVGLLRQDMEVLRRDVGETRRDVAQLHREVGETRRDIGQLHQEMGEMRQDMGQFRQEMGGMRRDIGMMHADIAAIRTALVPRDTLGGD